MAVERLTDYTRRIWTALDADAPEGHDFEVGDVIYYMDSSQCGIVTYVYPEGSIDVEFLPDVGGGGGGGGYSADDNVSVRIGNQSGTTIAGTSVWYDPTLSCLMTEAFPTNIANGAFRNVFALNQGGWFALRLRFTSAHTPVNVTYNGNNLPFDYHGDDVSVWYMRLQMPADYSTDTQIIIS